MTTVSGDGPQITATGTGTSVTVTITTGGGGGGGGGGATTLDGLTDVVITAAASGDILRHNGTNWVDIPGSDFYQPVDSDLTAIAALTTTSYGRAFLALVDAAAGRTALGLGTAATAASGDFATSAQGGKADTALQPTIVDADSDLIVGTAADTVGRLAVGASRIVGRKASGSIAALTAAEARTILGVEQTISDTTVGSGGAASIEITGLASYLTIEVHWYARSSDAVNNAVPMLARFNSDSGSNYNRSIYNRALNATNSANTTGQTSGLVALMPGSQTNTNRVASGVITLFCQQPAAARKVIYGQFTGGQSTSDNTGVGYYATEWTNTADALSTLTLLPNSGSFVEGSRFIVRGRTA